ncbi:hypothetical protein EDEG_02538 [Edhazardia aedis USNM 41457]|uniref:Uncharacterized protein n=1 Tax=Edhazardia aedis (strain USNM 41457) TaxID=1003232 RepID=J9D6C4_EDHAE|nr:hypothetical protein EDEG_02538 [Edhazardia aedis USNM 41457]|eukprot:EJW03059.1 hypothetical protein EDEG_02538 [Edhazardia aedis USNM 41457]
MVINNKNKINDNIEANNTNTNVNITDKGNITTCDSINGANNLEKLIIVMKFMKNAVKVMNRFFIVILHLIRTFCAKTVMLHVQKKWIIMFILVIPEILTILMLT